MVTESVRGQALCALAMAVVGTTVVASGVIGREVEPFLANALRHALALPVFLALAWRAGVKLPRVSGHDAALLLVQAAAGSVGYTVLLIEGVNRAGAADAGIVAGTLPAVAALFSALFLGERPGWRLAAAVVLASGGVMAVAVSPAATAALPQRTLGLVLVLAAVACEAVFILANKRLQRPLPALPMSALMCAGGLVLSLLPAALAWRPGVLPGAAAWAGIAWYAWVPTVLGFLLWYAGAARTSGVRAALATAALPVSALFVSALLFGEPVGGWQWLGLALVVAAVALAATAPRKAAGGA